jgi:hypothetical protein
MPRHREARSQKGGGIIQGTPKRNVKRARSWSALAHDESGKLVPPDVNPGERILFVGVVSLSSTPSWS